MKIGLLLPSTFAVANLGNGILAQAKHQASALKQIGHEVVHLDPWNPAAAAEVDLIHFYLGGYSTHGIETEPRNVPLVFSPIIDSNQSNRSYRFAAALGSAHSRIDTSPAVLRAQALGSDVVIARSEHEKTRIVQGLGVSSAKVSKVLNGVVPTASIDSQSALQHNKLPAKFLLHVSTYTQQRKNAISLIEAVGPTGYTLVIAGDRDAGDLKPQVEQAASRFPNIKLMGYLPREELLALYAAAHAFCLPSTHEGTGLVALEAAVHGCGIMITKNGGPPDYFESFVEYVDPFSVASIREAATKLWESVPDERLKMHISTNLTWEKSAHALVAAYQQALLNYKASN